MAYEVSKSQFLKRFLVLRKGAGEEDAELRCVEDFFLRWSVMSAAEV